MGGRPALPWQVKVLHSRAPVRVILGGYGSGKTTGAALALASHALSTPWLETYEASHPESLVIGKTDKVLKDSSMRTLRQVIPRQLIRKEWTSPGERSLLLSNGHLIKFRTWSGSIEGLSVTSIWIDEAHLLDDSQAFTNYVARMRDPLCDRKLALISGIPEYGWLQQLFGPDAQYPGAETWHVSTYENTHLHPDDIKRIEASCSARNASVYLRGQWTAPEGAVFPDYDAARHITPEKGDRSVPVDIGMDVGNKSAIVFAQVLPTCLDADNRRIPGKRIHIVDELVPEDLSCEAACKQIKARGWRVEPGRSTIFVDPTTDRDERNAIERAFPGVNIIRKQRADEAKNVEYGIRCINAAFADANGIARLTLYHGLPRSPRGLIQALPSFRRSENNGKVVKDNRMDHIVDALRYVVAHHLPRKGIRDE